MTHSPHSLAVLLPALLLPALLITGVCGQAPSDALTREQARAALRRAVQFFDQEVSIDGGYVYRYSADLKRREGEGQATATTAWVQPPGTPTVGRAILDAHRRTEDPALLAAALRAAAALVQGQLESGGWDYRIEFGEGRERYAYRRRPAGKRPRNVTTLDDNTTQAALAFLIEVDRQQQFADRDVHEAVAYGLRQLMAAQYPNGAWPQRFESPPDPAAFPVLKASYPESWPKTHPNVDYRSYYTLNDNTLADMIRLMFLAGEVYSNDDYRAAARRGGEFILLAQMPAPQPAWAQQYNSQMQPAWARKFEPPAVTGGESQGVMETLLHLYDQTGEQKYLDAVAAAAQYLLRSRLPDGRLARFYELRENRPLFFTRGYELTDRADDLPTHYAFIVSSKVERIERRRQERAAKGPQPRAAAGPLRPSPERLTPALRKQAAAAVQALDERGAWVEPGTLRFHEPTTRVIDTRTFVRNLETLSRFVAAAP